MIENKYDFSVLFKELEDDLEFKIEETISQFTCLVVEAMENKNIKTKKQLAKLLNMSSPAVTKLLSGNGNISIKQMVEISEKLGFEFKIVDKNAYEKAF